MWVELEDGPPLGLHLGMAGRIVIDGNGSQRGWDRFKITSRTAGARAARQAAARPRRARPRPVAARSGRRGGRARRVPRSRRPRHAPLKARIMDQSMIAGVGNLLADEALWRAGLSPLRAAGSLSDEELDGLRRVIRAATRRAIRRGGVHTGDLIPHRERGGACPHCGTPLERETVGGRTPTGARATSRASLFPALPPGPRIPPPLQVARFIRRGGTFLAECRERYGNVFTLRMMLGRPQVMLAEPEYVDLVGRPPAPADAGRRFLLEPILGRARCCCEGAEHLRRRKLMLPPFHGERMRAYEEVIASRPSARSRPGRAGSSSRCYPRIQSLTLDVILRAVFGVEAHRASGDCARRLLDDARGRHHRLGLECCARSAASRGPARPHAAQPSTSAIRGDRPSPPGDRPGRARGHPVHAPAARDEDGQRDERRRAARRAGDAAGRGPRDHRDRAGLDLRALFAPPATSTRAREARPRATTSTCRGVRETLRVRPVVRGRAPWAPRRRRTAGRCRSGRVAPSISPEQRRADLSRTRSRSGPSVPRGKPVTYTWIPFGGGTRRCVGMAFAQFEMRRVLATILEHADLAPRNGRGRADRAPPGDAGAAQRHPCGAPGLTRHFAQNRLIVGRSSNGSKRMRLLARSPLTGLDPG